jgi:hypothetical protein
MKVPSLEETIRTMPQLLEINFIRGECLEVTDDGFAEVTLPGSPVPRT